MGIMQVGVFLAKSLVIAKKGADEHCSQETNPKSRNQFLSCFLEKCVVWLSSTVISLNELRDLHYLYAGRVFRAHGGGGHCRWVGRSGRFFPQAPCGICTPAPRKIFGSVPQKVPVHLRM